MASYVWPSSGGSGVAGVSSLNGLLGDLTLVGGTGITVTPSGSTITISSTGGGSGTVTSVAMTVPSFLIVSGSPITTAGTLAVTLATETANTVFAGPATGAAATPTFRALVAADLPAGTGTVTSVALTSPGVLYTVSGSPITTSGTLALNLISQTANTFLAAPNGSAGTPSFRAIVPADVPTLNQNTTGTAANITATTNSTLTTLSALSLPGAQVTGNIAGNAANITGSISLTTQVSGILPVANGGTGDASFVANQVILGGTTTTGALAQVAAGTTGQVLTSTGTTAPTWQTPAPALVAPTIQMFTSGSGTYTLPTSPRSPLYLRVKALGGGGGGGGSGDSGGGTGGTGGNTTFSTFITSGGGSGGSGAPGGAGGSGGSSSITTSGSVIQVNSVQGGSGGGVPSSVTLSTPNVFAFAGAMGASSSFGGGGGGGAFTVGSAAPANSGAGGGGAGSTEDTTNNSGAGGGAGGYSEVIITSPSSTYTYAVGASGSAGATGSTGFAGGLGGNGILIVEEFYQ